MLVPVGRSLASFARSLSRGPRRAIVTASAGLALTSAAHAQWSVISLHPAGAVNSRALGTFAGQHVGDVDGEAAVWNGTTSSFVDLGPGYAVATDGQHQVGQDAGDHPRRWAGTAATGVGLPYGIGAGVVTAIDQSIAVGWIRTTPHLGPNQYSGVSWYVGSYIAGGGPSGGSTPAGDTFLYGISAGDFVGTAGPGPGASLWRSSTAYNYVDLSPAGSTESRAVDVYGNTQVGWAIFGTRHAGLWNGSSASWVDLQPSGSTQSEALAVFGAHQVGYATFAGAEHAGLWTGTANTWFDLHALLPATYTASRATGAWGDANGSEFVCGWAVNASGHTEAFLWRTLSTGSTFCFGDGSVTLCPCGNQGVSPRGCANSIEPLGARLVATGVASVGNDQLQLNVIGVPNGPGLFFQGTNQVAGGLGATFGDGLRCAGGSIVRLGVVVSSGNAAQYPRAGIDPSVSAQGGPAVGNLYVYQHYYRDTASFCTSATFNLSNGVLVPWVP